MSVPFAWPEVLEEHRLGDDVHDHAFDSSTKTQRACLKNAIAFHDLLEKIPECEAVQCTYASKGYRHSVRRTTVPWVMVFCDATFSAPARLVAAIMQAHVAQVRHIAIVGMGKLMPPILVASGLMGIMDVFVVPQHITGVETLTSAMEVLRSKEQGRALFLHFRKEKNMMEQVRTHIHTLQIPIWKEECVPTIHAHRNLTSEQRAALQWAQSDAPLVGEIDAKAIYGGEPSLGAIAHLHASQVWAQGMEGCYIHDDLDRRFFQNTRMAAGTLVQHEGGEA